MLIKMQEEQDLERELKILIEFRALCVNKAEGKVMVKVQLSERGGATSVAARGDREEEGAWTPTKEVYAVQRKGHYSADEGYRPRNWGGRPGSVNVPCWRCGRLHSPDRCPVAGATCFKCESVGHLAKMCQHNQGGSQSRGSSMKSKSKGGGKHVRHVKINQASDTSSEGEASDFKSYDP